MRGPKWPPGRRMEQVRCKHRQMMVLGSVDDDPKLNRKPERETAVLHSAICLNPKFMLR